MAKIPQIEPDWHNVNRIGLAALVLSIAYAGAANAVPNWKKDGRPGYPTRDQAKALAGQFTRTGAPREGRKFLIFRDPDGGFTPVFYDPNRTHDFGT